MAFQLVALTFIRSHVATARILWIGAWHTTLIRLQQMTVAVGTATRVACINRRASREERDSLCRPAVVAQLPQHRVDVVHITGAFETAGAITAQVVAFRGYTAVTISPRSAVGDNAVLERRWPAENLAAHVSGDVAGGVSGVPAKGAVVNYQRAACVDAAATRWTGQERRHELATGLGHISAERAVVDRERGVCPVCDTAAKGVASG